MLLVHRESNRVNRSALIELTTAQSSIPTLPLPSSSPTLVPLSLPSAETQEPSTIPSPSPAALIDDPSYIPSSTPTAGTEIDTLPNGHNATIRIKYADIIGISYQLTSTNNYISTVSNKCTKRCKHTGTNKCTELKWVMTMYFLLTNQPAC
jgi:hypothetical protein